MSAARLSAPELRAAALDGELGRVGAAFLPLDVPLDTRTRLAALNPVRGDARVIVSDRCAAWVWGWSHAPCPVLCCCVSSRSRVASTTRRALGVREAVIDSDEIVTLDGVTLTTPVRTLIDLASHDDRADLPRLLAAAIGVDDGRGELTEELVGEALARRPSAAYSRRARARQERARRDARRQPLLTR